MFNLDVIEHETKRLPFEFTADGKQYRIPHAAELTLGQQVAADSNRLDRVFREVAEVLDGEEWKPAGRKGAEVILARHPDQIAALTVAWLAWAGLEPGESAASSR